MCHIFLPLHILISFAFSITRHDGHERQKESALGIFHPGRVIICVLRLVGTSRSNPATKIKWASHYKERDLQNSLNWSFQQLVSMQHSSFSKQTFIQSSILQRGSYLSPPRLASKSMCNLTFLLLLTYQSKRLISNTKTYLTESVTGQ